MSKDLVRTLIKFKTFFQALPGETTKALRKIQEGKIKIDIEDKEIRNLSTEIDRSSNRLAYSMVIAALLVAGALTINVVMPKIFGIPWISFLAYLIAAIIGLVLLVSILKEKEVRK